MFVHAIHICNCRMEILAQNASAELDGSFDVELASAMALVDQKMPLSSREASASAPKPAANAPTYSAAAAIARRTKPTPKPVVKPDFVF